MRPRLLHLGYLTGQELPRDRMTRFNEAEAFTPRIQIGAEFLGIESPDLLQ